MRPGRGDGAARARAHGPTTEGRRRARARGTLLGALGFALASACSGQEDHVAPEREDAGLEREDAGLERADAAPGRAAAVLDRQDAGLERQDAVPARAVVEALVHDHARAWEDGDTALVRSIVHEDAVLAYPRRRVDHETWVRELAAFAREQEDTRVYVHEILVDGDRFAVEWQFATTERASGVRTAVSDAILGQVRDGRIVLWKEYLDGRVHEAQRAGDLPLDEGGEPFPWPAVPDSAAAGGSSDASAAARPGPFPTREPLNP